MQLQHSQPGTLPSTVRLDQDYLREIVNKFSFPRVFGTPELLDVWPLVREIEQVEEQFREVRDGPAMTELLKQFLALYGKLACVMAK
jgi:hypothetical protein